MMKNLMQAIGVGLIGYYWLYFSTTAPNSDILNIGLLTDQTNGILVGIGVLVAALGEKDIETDSEKVEKDEKDSE